MRNTSFWWIWNLIFVKSGRLKNMKKKKLQFQIRKIYCFHITNCATCATPSPTNPLPTFLNQQKSQTGQLEAPTDALTKIIFIAKRNILCSPGTIIDSTSSKAFVALIITIAIKTSYHSYHIVWESLWHWQTSWADIRWWVQVQVHIKIKQDKKKTLFTLSCWIWF